MHDRPIKLRALFRSALFVFLSWLLAAPIAADEDVLVRWALDGDSLLLADGRQVRLLGINAPEFGKDGKPEEPLARSARDRTSSLTRGKKIRLVQDKERTDRYGRTLAYAFLPDGSDVQETLLREGLAWYVAVPPNTARLSLHRAAETEARHLRRGVWNVRDYEPLSAESLTAAHTGFHRITGTIVNVRKFDNGVELQLTPTIRVILSGDAATDIARNPQALRGKRILARGWLTEYKGRLRLRINHPAMVEELS